MTREYYLTHKDKLQNREWRTYRDLPGWHKEALKSVPQYHVQLLSGSGNWFRAEGNDNIGMIYRVDPDWEGPAEPPTPPKPVYFDVVVRLETYGVYCFQLPDHPMSFAITLAPAIKGFVGYLYGTSETTIPQRELRFDSEGNIMIPLAVRFRKS
jgi:hypothetical protein